MPASTDKVDAVSEAFLKANSLYALYRGEQARHSEVDSDAATKIRKKQEEFEKFRDSELDRVKKSQAQVEQAKAELIKHQSEVREKYGAVIDLLAQPGGNRVNL